MEVSVLPASGLSSAQVDHWAALQAGQPTLASPFFRPEYVLALADVRDDVRVAVIGGGAEPLGFLPFQPGRIGVARAAGAELSDYQGLILAPGVEVALPGLLARAGLSALTFDHVPDSQASFRRHATFSAASPVMSMADGFEAYKSSGGSIGRQLSQIRRRRKQLIREVGEPRFVIHTEDPDDFRWLMARKSEQYDRLGTADRFGAPWIVDFLARLLREHGEDFGCLFSALYVDDRIIAGHLGLRAGGVWHWWFPTYDPELSRYSPGLLLLMEMATAAEGIGVAAIDFGRGEERYKERLANRHEGLLQGVAARRTPVGMLARGANAAKDRLRDSPLRDQLRTARDIPHRLRARRRA
ncbi:MAG: GNAT family N-acetyltransferase [Thermoleophilia bacterium]|nr:GNAT family N-acetyltransferase [Thermoleophilia bacterium]MDH3724753.1 GNAT family N-acetyltransferase [Thermoleophilia bacterium]